MRVGGAVFATAVLCVLLAAPAQATPHFTIGQGQSPGVAVDAAGTAYIGWKVNVYADQGDAVQLCVLPRGARACAQLTTIPFLGSGYNLGRVSVLLPGPPGLVQVTVGRSEGAFYGMYVATSVNGGATFEAPVVLRSGFGLGADVLPDGRIATVGTGALVLTGSVRRPDGSDAALDSIELDDGRGQFNDVAVQGSDVYVAGSSAGPSTIATLPAGADWTNPADWIRLPEVNGEQPQLAPGPLGIAVLAEPVPAASGQVFAQRWAGTGWTAPIALGSAGYNDSFALTGAGGRLTAVWSWGPPGPFDKLVEIATSTDGGALWSSVATLAETPRPNYELEAAIAPDGVGVAVNGGGTSAEPIVVYVIDPGRANVARARFGSTTVQLRSDAGDCIEEERTRLRVEAAQNGVRVNPSRALRRVRVSGRRGSVNVRWTRRVNLGRARAKRIVRVRFVPRRGHARTVRFVVRGCGRIA